MALKRRVKFHYQLKDQITKYYLVSFRIHLKKEELPSDGLDSNVDMCMYVLWYFVSCSYLCCGVISCLFKLSYGV